MKDPLSACDERCSMLPRRHIMSPSFDAIQLHVRVIEESMEYADRVASTADTGDHAPWQFAILLQDLSTGLSAHVDLGLQTESRAGHCSRDSMLSRSCLGYDPTLSHLLCE